MSSRSTVGTDPTTPRHRALRLRRPRQHACATASSELGPFRSADARNVLQQLLDEGGSEGRIFLAADVETNDLVAFKQFTSDLGPGISGRDLRARLRTLRAASLQLRHVPGLVGYLDPFEGGAPGTDWARPGWWLPMEFVPGESLAAILARGVDAPECRTLLEALGSVATTLGQLAGLRPPVAHRDVKPANIMVRTTSSGALEWVLVDIGLLTRADRQHFSVVGSNGYIAPELSDARPVWLSLMLLHCFNPDGCDEWDLRGRPVVRAGMPVLIDDDLRFEDEHGPRPATVMNRWLRELPVSGAPSPRTWRAYAQVLKAWAEFLDAGGFGVFDERRQLRGALSAYAEHRLSGPVQVRLAPASWNLAVKALSAFYTWAAAEDQVAAVLFSYARQMIIRPDGARVEITGNLATVRTGNAHAARKYLEAPYVQLLMNALAGNDPAGAPDGSFRGRETGRNAAVIGLALASGLRAGEFTHLTVFEVPPLPGRRTPIPVPLPLAPPTTKGGRGRSSWIDFDALARVHDYIALERAATVAGSRWLPRDPLHLTDATYDGARVNEVRRRWASLTPDERPRLVAPGGGSALLAVQAGGGPFVDWASVLTRTSDRIRARFEPGFPHVHPHMTRHSFAMATLERLVAGYYRQAAKLVADTGGDAALALYLTKADPLLVLRDLLGHASAATTQSYLHLLDTQRIYRDAYFAADPCEGEDATMTPPADEQF